jgi:hypothetical protein
VRNGANKNRLFAYTGWDGSFGVLVTGAVQIARVDITTRKTETKENTVGKRTLTSLKKL